MSPGTLPEEEVLDAADEPRALFEPVDRVVDRLLQLLTAGELCARRHRISAEVGWDRARTRDRSRAHRDTSTPTCGSSPARPTPWTCETE